MILRKNESGVKIMIIQDFIVLFVNLDYMLNAFLDINNKIRN